jgi:periplasmic copper chaperone A
MTVTLRKSSLIFMASTLAMGTLTACNVDKRVLGVVDIEVTAGQKLLNPSFATFTVEGGAQDVKLMHVSSPSAIVTRIVDSKGKTVTIDEGIVIKAGQKVRFGPGEDYGVELDRVNRIPRGTNKIDISFVFSNGQRQYATAPYVIPDGAEEI